MEVCKKRHTSRLSRWLGHNCCHYILHRKDHVATFHVSMFRAEDVQLDQLGTIHASCQSYSHHLNSDIPSTPSNKNPAETLHLMFVNHIVFFQQKHVAENSIVEPHELEAQWQSPGASSVEIMDCCFLCVWPTIGNWCCHLVSLRLDFQFQWIVDSLDRRKFSLWFHMAISGWWMKPSDFPHQQTASIRFPKITIWNHDEKSPSNKHWLLWNHYVLINLSHR